MRSKRQIDLSELKIPLPIHYKMSSLTKEAPISLQILSNHVQTPSEGSYRVPLIHTGSFASVQTKSNQIKNSIDPQY